LGGPVTPEPLNRFP